jgi:hypothetical protein
LRELLQGFLEHFLELGGITILAALAALGALAALYHLLNHLHDLVHVYGVSAAYAG